MQSVSLHLPVERPLERNILDILPRDKYAFPISIPAAAVSGLVHYREKGVEAECDTKYRGGNLP